MRKSKIIMLGLFLAFTCVFQSYAESIDDLQQKIKSNDEKIEQARISREKAEAEKSTITEDISKLEQQIQNSRNEISRLEGELSQLEKDIAAKEQEIKKAGEDLNKQLENFKGRLKAMYSQSGTSYLSMLLESKSLAEMYQKLKLMQSISKHDKTELDNICKTKEQLEKDKNKLEEDRNRVAAIKQQQVAVQSELNSNLNAKQEYLNKVNSNIDQYTKMEAELQAQSAEIAKMIKQIIAAQKSTQKYVGGIMNWPAPGNYNITSPYGERIHPVYKTKIFHTGIDIAAPMGSDIIAANSGTVIFSGWNGGYGNCIIIDHGGGISTLYAHCSRLLVSKGELVSAKQTIAAIGSTGISTGPHLHFEVRINGDHTDPMSYLK